MFTRFIDMHSGGGQKEKWAYIFIEALEEEAKIIFYNRFGHNPERVTCTCCGDDYSINESETLEQATGYDRGCKYNNGQYEEVQDSGRSYRKYMPLDEYLQKEDVLVIYAKDIKTEEKQGEVPTEGYVWV